MQLHCAVSGVLCVYFVTLLQATPDRFQYLPHVQHVGQQGFEQLYDSNQGYSYCPQELSPAVHKMNIITNFLSK